MNPLEHIHTENEFPSLVHHFLIAMPSLADSPFTGALVYICEHSSKGALGLVVNKPSRTTVQSLLKKVDLVADAHTWSIRPVLIGGPVQNHCGFVLHTPHDGDWASTISINEELSLTTSKDILQSMVNGVGPVRWLITLGYAGWSAGQLDQEIARNGWLTVPANERILFDVAPEDRFEQAFKLLGFEPWVLSATAGHA